MRKVYGANVIVFEGIFTFFDPCVRDLMDIKIFVDTDDDVRLARRCTLSRSLTFANSPSEKGHCIEREGHQWGFASIQQVCKASV